jgi:hypothetical protein
MVGKNQMEKEEGKASIGMEEGLRRHILSL